MTTLDPRGLEAAARELFESEKNTAVVEYPEWDSPENVGKPLYIEDAESAITAYLAVTQPTVETVAELEGLEVGAVVLDSHQEELVNLPEGWYCIAHNERALPHEDIALPARVIWRPHESA